jgi:hypothetical protein
MNKAQSAAHVARIDRMATVLQMAGYRVQRVKWKLFVNLPTTELAFVPFTVYPDQVVGSFGHLSRAVRDEGAAVMKLLAEAFELTKEKAQ